MSVMRVSIHIFSATALMLLAIGFPAVPGAVAAGSASKAFKVIERCMANKDAESSNQCIGQYSDACVLKGDAQSDYFAQANCLRDEATAWRNFRDGAAASFLVDNGTSFSASIVHAAQASDKFATVKCAVFQDTSMFGQSGMSLEAECLRDEAARMAIFISRHLD